MKYLMNCFKIDAKAFPKVQIVKICCFFVLFFYPERAAKMFSDQIPDNIRISSGFEPVAIKNVYMDSRKDVQNATNLGATARSVKWLRS